ncbi:MAG TPA: histidine--tRNA ligase [Kofleriaceae bacterium]
MLDTIRRGFERFGFLPVETPVFEVVDVLLTKSGGETEKQVYFVQSTGALETGKKPELALRFDLTVPLARYVAEHEAQLNFPFRRYQIQRVYRGERAQKGRYREFYQCDVDVIGKDSLSIAYDSELPALIAGIFTELAFGKFTIFVNNRKLLRGLLESLGITLDKHADVLHEVDRLRKLGRAEVELRVAPLVGVEIGRELLDALTGPIDALRSRDNAILREGLDELDRVYKGTLALGVPESQIKINLSIVRGLDYYTGTVYETFLDDHPDYGSICSGGRYDNLAGHYTKSKLPGVGISIGVTRLLAQMLEAEKATPAKRAIADVVILNFDVAFAADYAAMARELRDAGYNVDVYGGADKPAKQFKYADRAGIPLAIVVGAREHQNGVVKLKDLRLVENNERDVLRENLVAAVRELLSARA